MVESKPRVAPCLFARKVADRKKLHDAREETCLREKESAQILKVKLGMNHDLWEEEDQY